MTSSAKTILIIDDNPEDRQTYSRYLHRDNLCTYNILEAEAGEEGLELAARCCPDLILLDFNLPDTDGLEFIAESKQNNDSLPPIIVLTGAGNRRSP